MSIQKDWRVSCSSCGTTYTPKARTRPTQCVSCSSPNIEVVCL